MRGLRVSFGGAVGGVAVMVATLLVAPAPAAGQPTSVAGLLAHYHDLSKEAERVNEELLLVQESLAGQRKASAKARTAADDARTAADRARHRASTVPDLDQYADALARRRGLTALSALADSTSPDDLLGRLRAVALASRLTSTGTEGDAALAAAEQAERAADTAEDAAARAEAEVAAGTTDLQRRRADLDRQIREVRAALDRLTPEQRSLLAGAEDYGDDVVIPGGDIGGMLEFALAQMGKPYLWGAVGPNAYDCSGLVQTAFRKIGVEVPRVSRVQATVGQSIPRSQVRAGDLIFYYNPVQHVAIAVDDTRAVHAPSFGESVKIAGIDAIGPITVIRRVIA
ncbi:C40 family peptidase [Actinophytocola gossypii]|uniref:C40 family peptidase n=1 Tax=Actinophytocola gossypii TaxID=2812003 RepID=A0ABT2J687_9PSEU|nr:C40 family peptidase [Actinophytocola gossypii]MCT2583378.1 C40 family peptidase [Actinophytocola gossypii]